MRRLSPFGVFVAIVADAYCLFDREQTTKKESRRKVQAWADFRSMVEMLFSQK